jgi:hypothetical protein
MSYMLFENDKININFAFTKQELKDFKELWNADISAENIAVKLNRRPLEIALLIIDRGELGLIKERDSGLDGL